MKKNRKSIICPLLSACLGLSTLILVSAGISSVIKPPSHPGRPNTFSVHETECRINYLTPQNDGGEPVKNYYTEYRNQWDLSWKFRGASKTNEFQFKNMREKSWAQFRVSASNSAGISRPSGNSSFIKFRGPFDE